MSTRFKKTLNPAHQLIERGRVIEFEEENHASKERAFQKAKWCLFDFHNETNNPIIDEMKFVDPKDTKFTICVIDVDENGELGIASLFRQYDVFLNGKKLVQLERYPLKEGDKFEVLGIKYLIHTMGNVDASTIKKMVGLEVINKTVLGLKKSLSEGQERMIALEQQIQEYEAVRDGFKQQFERREGIKEQIIGIIEERKRLKALYFELKNEFDGLWKMKLEEKLAKEEGRLEGCYSQKEQLTKELNKLSGEIAKKEDFDKERKELVRAQEKRKLEMEKLELLNKIASLEKASKMLETGEEENTNEDVTAPSKSIPDSIANSTIVDEEIPSLDFSFDKTGSEDS